MSEGQRALWFMSQLDPESPFYNIPNAFRLRGPLDRAALRRAFAALLVRHPLLRATFVATSGEPVARVGDPSTLRLPFTIEDVSADPGGLTARLNADALRPFALESDLPLRACLFVLGADDHVLQVTFHHMVMDFWSQRLLLADLSALYLAEKTGEPAVLMPLETHYADYATWQRDLSAGPEGERLARYWTEQLQGPLPVLELPTFKPRPEIQSFEGAVRKLRMGADLTAEIKRFARERGTTPFVVLLAAYQTLLYRYTGQDDVIVGTVTAGRTHATFADVVGYMVNTVALRGRPRSDVSFEAFVAETKQTVLTAFEHQDLSFSRIVERVHPERDPARSPVFQTMFVLQNAPGPDGDALTRLAMNEADVRLPWADLVLEGLPLDQRIAQFDLTLTMGEADGDFIATFDYCTELFEPAFIEAMGEHFRTLLWGAVRSPKHALGAVPLLTEAEQQKLTHDWNDTACPPPDYPSVQAWIEAVASRCPEEAALVSGGETLSYAELETRSNRLAHRLIRQGVSRETIVALRLERGIELVVAMIAVLKAGGAFLPIDPLYPDERVAQMLDDAGAGLVLNSEVLAGDWSAEPSTPPVRGVDPGHLACLIHTSGSTGLPKATMVEHRALLNLIASFHESYAPTAVDRILPLTSIASISFVGEVLPLLCAGGAVVIPRREEMLDEVQLQALIESSRVTILSTLPSRLTSLEHAATSLAHLRLLLSGGEALSTADLAHLPPQVELFNGYGLTETGACSTYHRIERTELAADRPVPIGKPIRNTQVYLLDATLQPVPVGCVGELFIAGDGLARAYLNRPELTAERFLPNPFVPGGRMYRTGDLARFTGDGNLEFAGRRDHQVKIRGHRVEPGEIEAALRRHPAVRDAVVVVRGEAHLERQLVAYWTAPSDTAAPPAEAFLAFLRERLPEHMIPAFVVRLPELPFLPNGKVAREALPEPQGERPLIGSSYVAPRNVLERQIADIWKAALRLDQVGMDDNFFDLGGHSLLLAQVHQQLKAQLERDLSLVDLFRFPTVGSLAAHLAPSTSSPPKPEAPLARTTPTREGIAIIGMAGRFPGADNLFAFWDNLRNGVESITHYTADELIAAGVDPALVADPNYVKAKGAIGKVDAFDATFFGVSPREAELMDPQHRVFLECAWEAMERAGYDSLRYPGRIGVFGGASMNTYLVTNLISHMTLVASTDTLQASLGNDKDPLTSRVAYKLGLRGPSITIQSASSTSLVAVHVACEALLAGTCEMALAGGVSIHLPETSGYMYQEGGTTARDGHCRAFDAEATGFVSGNGAGIVLLKRLSDALRDGDHIHAVIQGTACNNDGSQKVSFTAPSVEGQVDVYRQALAAAEVRPEDVTYMECHGTGTAMGDPIEVAALNEVYGGAGREPGSVALGSLKTNIGHLDVAAGVCGLIKAALTVEHGEFVPTLHFKTPNPRIAFEQTPFVVNTERRAWTSKRRLAGVTSLGMGGTNAHVIVGEAPQPEPSGESRHHQLLVLSAKTPSALESLSHNLATHLEANPDLQLGDVSFVLLGGRRAFGHRQALVCSSREEAIASLRTGPSRDLMMSTYSGGTPSVAFMFPGQGTQYVDMGRGLYETEPVFRAEVDRACELLRGDLGFDLREKLYPATGEDTEAASRELEQTSVTQPALFVIEFALAKLLMSWGIQPQAMVGHSLGEYVAACLAGVFELPDALALVAARGRLMQSMAPGSMLAVAAPREQVASLLPGTLTIATVNDPNSCVVAGPTDAVLEFQRGLEDMGLAGRLLRTSHAFHSAMLDPALSPFRECVRAVTLHRPTIPFLSNVTGTWITDSQATDPEYWVSQMRQPVLFAPAVGVMMEEPSRICVEVGPGQSLASAVRQHPAARGHEVVSAMRHPKGSDDDQRVVLRALGQLWNAGVTVDPAGFFAGERRTRVILPTYPFERKRFWVEPKKSLDRPQPSDEGRAPERDWYYAPVWSEVPVQRRDLHDLPVARTNTWVITGGSPMEPGLIEALSERSGPVTTLRSGQRFLRVSPTEAELDLADPISWEQALAELPAPSRIVLIAMRSGAGATVESRLEEAFFVPMALAQALGKQSSSHAIDLVVVSQGLFEVLGSEETDPVRASMLGPIRVIPLEYPTIRCRLIDLPGQDDPRHTFRGGDRSLRDLVREIAEPSHETEVALRGGRRWVRSYQRVPLTGRLDAGTAVLREGGTYVITGGLGGIGLELAGAIASRVRANLVLLGRTGLPPRDAWASIALGEDEQAQRVRRLLDMEARYGAQIEVLAVDVADPVELRAAVARVRERFGTVHGVIHAAGVPGGGLILGRQREAAGAVFAGKLMGALALDSAFEGEPFDFVVLCSSLTVQVPVPGQTDYVAANAVLDALAEKRFRQGLPYLAIQWDAWREVGMALRSESEREVSHLRNPLLSDGLSSDEGVTCFLTALGSEQPAVLVSTRSLSARQAQARTIEALEAVVPKGTADNSPVEADSAVRAIAQATGEDLEERIAAVWREMLGLPHLSYDDGFFDLGGTSLIAISLMQRLRNETGVELSVARLFQAPTVRGIANYVRESLGVTNEEATVAQESLLRGQRRRDRRTHR
ncbi:MAG TPA: amino acid adenylation domain-containing protein [Stenomitos sp.]